MAFGSRTLKYSGPSGKLTARGGEYRQVWHCTVTDPLDGPITIFNYFKLNGPYFGSYYQNGNETDLTSILSEIDVPQHIDGSATEYVVVCSYTPMSISSPEQRPSPSRRDKETGNPTPRPWRWQPEISVVFTPQQVPVYEAVYLSGFTGKRAELVSPGSAFIPSNSNMVPFDPPLEKDDNRLTLRIKDWRILFNIDEAKSTINAVNKFPVRFSNAKYHPVTGKLIEGYYGNFAEHSLKVTGIDAAYRWEVNEDIETEYYEISIDVQWREKGWHEFVVDRGLSITVDDGRDNGRGSKFSMSPLKNAATFTPVQGMDGEPITDPVLLNGDGEVLPAGQLPVYLEYKLYTEVDYTKDPFLNLYFTQASPV